MKKHILIISICLNCILSITTGFLWYMYPAQDIKQADTARMNVKKIKDGMEISEVTEIMGQPNYIHNAAKGANLVYTTKYPFCHIYT